MFCYNLFLLAIDLIEYNKATLITSTARDNLYRKTLVNSFLKFDVVYRQYIEPMLTLQHYLSSFSS